MLMQTHNLESGETTADEGGEALFLGIANI